MTLCKKCSYNRCDGSGLIPFMKDGVEVPHVFIYCDCHPVYGIDPEPERYVPPPRPEDYDFPMSEEYRAWTYSHCGVHDPGFIPPQPDLTEIEDRLNDIEADIVRPGSIPRRYHDQLQQIRANVLTLQNRLSRLTVQKVKETKPPAGADTPDMIDITDRYMR